jgi:GTP-binding protein
MSGIVAIIGRPNVGKSTLFNRLTESRRAIVDEVAGVTRDRIYGSAEWNGREFTVVDTGGFAQGSEDVFEDEIRKQIELAIKEANVLLFLVDVSDGVLEWDKEVANLVRRSKKPYVLVVNKVDNHKRQDMATEFYEFGLGEYFCISSANGFGTGEMLDALVEKLPEEVKEDEDLLGLPRLTIIGRPNVGKSSFLNALIGEERNIVTDIAGTTRDAIHTRYNRFGFDFFLVDTAGVRKKSRVNEDLEFYSVMRSLKALENSDVCFIMIDATQGFDAQDVNLFQLCIKNRKGIVILVNKWDLVEKDTHSVKEYTELIKEKIAPFKDVPILFISALTKQRIHQALEEAVEVYNNRERRIPTHKLNETMLPYIEAYPPPAIKGKYVKIKFVTQLPTRAPSFAFFCNLPQYVYEPYKRYIENKLRENFNFKGVPIQIFFRQK